MTTTAHDRKLKIQARKLTAAECLAKAEEADREAETWGSSRDRAWSRRSALGWRKLAAERAVEEAAG